MTEETLVIAGLLSCLCVGGLKAKAVCALGEGLEKPEREVLCRRFRVFRVPWHRGDVNRLKGEERSISIYFNISGRIFFTFFSGMPWKIFLSPQF